jgi:hypothetical protein
MQLAIKIRTKQQLVPIIWKEDVGFDVFIQGETTAKLLGTLGQNAIIVRLQPPYKPKPFISEIFSNKKALNGKET